MDKGLSGTHTGVRSRNREILRRLLTDSRRD